MQKFFKFALCASALSAFVFSAQSAHAKIVCEGRYQKIRGNLLSTPYCENRYLASVARKYGMKVSGKAIHSNPSKKKRVCRFIGHDSRVSNICAGYLYTKNCIGITGC